MGSECVRYEVSTREMNRFWKEIVLMIAQRGECINTLNCALEHGRDGRFCVLCMLPQLKREQNQDQLRPLQGPHAQDRIVVLVVSGVISKW